MRIESLRDLERVVRRVQEASTSLRSLQSRFGRRLTPPFPVPLTLMALEQWFRTAEDALKRPKIAQSKKLLGDVGIDPAPIPAMVLSETERIEANLDRLASLPNELKDRALPLVGHALTKGADDADSITSDVCDLADSLRPILELQASCPEAVGVVLSAVPESTEQFPSYLKSALAIRDYLSQTARLGVPVSDDWESMPELEGELSRFDKAYRGLHELVSTEGITHEHLLDVKGLAVSEAADTCDTKRADVLKEKESLQGCYGDAAKRLMAMGTSVVDAPGTIGELRAAVAEIDKLLAQRHKELVGTLGKDAVLLVESVMTGGLPPAAALDDQRLGCAIRKAVDSGFQIRIEAPHEDQ